MHPPVSTLADPSTVDPDAGLLDRLVVPLDRDQWEQVLDVVHPARDVIDTPTYRALEKYAYNEVGPVLVPFTHPEMKVHFLPHVGIHLVRTFPDPRITSQYTLHQWMHCFYGWPLPVASNLARYEKACSAGEVLAAMETEFALFEELPEATAGMFDPAYPSLHDAFRAVGFRTFADAVREADRMQNASSEAEALPPHVRHHPAFQGGVAVTLLRQVAWAEHDREWARLNWHRQRANPLVRQLFASLWAPDGHASIFQRHKEGREALLLYDRTHDHDDRKHRTATLRSLLRTAALSLASAPGGGIDPNRHLLVPGVATPDDVRRAYEAALAGNRDAPMPLWDLATEFHAFRVAWEARLRARTAAWAA